MPETPSVAPAAAQNAAATSATLRSTGVNAGIAKRLALLRIAAAKAVSEINAM